ncbi:MAG: hypothetical protein RBR67_12575 [Desulfobacterium sp.]|nr:hypothetical protein [Desulfobacterium sp.]
MASIGPDYAGCVADTHFDPLGKKAAELLANLLPLAHVNLRYKTDCSQDSSRTLKGILHTSLMRVPGENQLWREITIKIDQKGRQFLGAANTSAMGDQNSSSTPLTAPLTRDSHRSEDISLLLNLPREAKYIAGVCDEVLQAWADNFDTGLFKEIELSAVAQFPLWVVSHIAAGIHCSFATDTSMERKKLTQTITNVLEYFINLASTRVEHQELNHGVVIAPATKGKRPLLKGIYPADFKGLKRTPLLSDGIRAALWISPSGEAIEWLSHRSFKGQTKKNNPVRYAYGDLDLLETASENLQGISLALSKRGSIIIIENGRALFVRRGGKWRGIIWRSVRDVIGRKHGQVAMLLFNAALILSTGGEGGILGIVSHPPNKIHDKDRVDFARRWIMGGKPTKGYPEWLFHALLPDDDAVSLGVEQIAMLAAIDGATLFNEAGKLIAYGAVLPMHPSGSEGSRSAAARELSEQGFVIKVSADGPITLYERGQEIVQI